jgi:hypothetical protein
MTGRQHSVYDQALRMLSHLTAFQLTVCDFSVCDLRLGDQSINVRTGLYRCFGAQILHWREGEILMELSGGTITGLKRLLLVELSGEKILVVSGESVILNGVRINCW